jgi:hypothetical protein
MLLRIPIQLNVLDIIVASELSHQPSAFDIIIGPVHLRTEDIKVHFSSCSQKDFRRTDQASLTSLTVQSSTPILKPSAVNNSANSAAPTLSVQICYCHASFLVPHAFRALWRSQKVVVSTSASTHQSDDTDAILGTSPLRWQLAEASIALTIF